MVLIAIMSTVLVMPVYLIGFPDGYDLGQHILFAERYGGAIADGQLIPSWAGNDNFGFGSAGIRFYPPLAHYFLALTKTAVGGWYTTIFLNVLFWMVLGCWGMYLWLRYTLDPRMSLLGAALYGIVPYHLFQIYQTVLYAEFAAAALLPFCFLFAHRVVTRPRWVDVVGFGIAYGLLLLTHIPTSLIASIGLGVFALCSASAGNRVRALSRFVIGAALGGSAAAFYLVRMATELSWIKHNSDQYYREGYYSYSQYFFPMFLSSADQYKEKLLWHLDIQIILISLLLVPSIIVAVRLFSKNGKGPAGTAPVVAAAVSGVFCLFMLSSLSSAVWKVATPLQKIQFPWRWLSLLSLFATASFVYACSHMRDRLASWSRLGFYLVGSVILVFSLFDITQNILQSGQLAPDKFDEKVAKIYREQSCECWWPVWAREAALQNKERVATDGRDFEVLEWTAEHRAIRLSGSAIPTVVRLATFYYPHWEARANGSSIPIDKDENGAMTVNAPAEETTLEISFEEPQKVTVARYFSVVVWAAMIGFLFYAAMAHISRRKFLPLID
jgi:hypothetical protein